MSLKIPSSCICSKWTTRSSHSMKDLLNRRKNDRYFTYVYINRGAWCRSKNIQSRVENTQRAYYSASKIH